MDNMIKVKFYSDPGHGWAAVKRDKLAELGVLDKVSVFSYQKGGTVYLEEDCDFAVFLDTCRSKDIKVSIEEHHTDNRSPIRSYNHFYLTVNHQT